jgi:hypothetical protein
MMQRNDHQIIDEQKIKKQQEQLPYYNQHHQQQILSLSDISPTWALRLKEKRSPLFLISLTRLQWLFEIINPKKCVVAEAHGFSSSYTNNCAECARVGNKFSLYFALYLPKKLKENQQRLVEHWNEKHL